MKSLLTQIGKFFAIVLYWGVTFGMGYLFYDDYLTEHKWTSLCYVAAFISAGIAAHGFLLKWIYQIEIEHFALRHKNSYPKIENAVSAISIVFAGLFIISFVAGLFGPFILTCGIGILVIMHATWEYWVAVFALLAISLLLRIPRNSVLLNTLAKISYRLSLFSFIAVIIYNEVLIFKVLSGNSPALEDNLIAGGIILLIAFAGVSYLLYKSSKKGIFSFASMRYVLFLRSFKDDNACRLTYSFLKKSINIPIKLIGNPSERDTWFNNEDSDEDLDTEMEKDMHWLPSRNWKFFLRFYIARAKAIVMFAGESDGLIWEVLENTKRLNKCVISFTSNKELKNFQTRLQELNNPKLKPLIYAITKFMRLNRFSDAFVIHKDKLYWGEVGVLTNQVLKNDFKEAIHVIDLSSNSASTKQSVWKSISNKVFRFFHILNFINTFESIQNVTIATTLKVLAGIVAVTFYLGTIAFAVALLLSPILVWTAPEFASQGTVEKIFETIFFVNIGVYLLKELLSKDK